MENISIEQASKIRSLIANYEMRKLINLLAKLKIFPCERLTIHSILCDNKWFESTETVKTTEQANNHNKLYQETAETIINNIPK